VSLIGIGQSPSAYKREKMPKVPHNTHCTAIQLTDGFIGAMRASI
jgi:hypothetical protein